MVTMTWSRASILKGCYSPWYSGTKRRRKSRSLRIGAPHVNVLFKLSTSTMAVWYIFFKILWCWLILCHLAGTQKYACFRTRCYSMGWKSFTFYRGHHSEFKRILKCLETGFINPQMYAMRMSNLWINIELSHVMIIKQQHTQESCPIGAETDILTTKVLSST